MEATEVQNPLKQDDAAVVTSKKKKTRRFRWRKSNSTNLDCETSVNRPTSPHFSSQSTLQSTLPSTLPHPEKIVKPIASPIANVIASNCVTSSIKSEVKKRRRYNKNRPEIEATKVENKSINPLDPNEKSVESTPSNNISRSYMDKMKRDDDAKSREHVQAERDARRLAKQKVQDKSRNLANTSPTKSLQKQDAIGEKKIEVRVEKLDKADGRSEKKKSLENASPKKSVQKQGAMVEKKVQEKVENKPSVTAIENIEKADNKSESKSDKTREEIKAERELKKQAKLAKKSKTTDVVTPVSATESTAKSITKQLENVIISEKPVLSKAERREKQEAQRAAKAKLLAEKAPKSAVQPTEKPKTEKVEKLSEKSPPTKKIISVKTTQHKVKLFNHLYADKGPENVLNSNVIHPAIVKLGAQYTNGNIVGSNARCIAFMERIKTVIEDYITPSQKEFGRGLEAILHPCINYLHQCRPLSVSITNAIKFIKWQISQLPANQTDAELKEHLLESMDTYVRDQIEKAAQAISIFVQEKISNGDVILTFGCSSLICHIIEEAQKRNVDFSVIVVDSRPHHEGQEMLRRLVAHKIRCTCVLINAIGFVMPDVTKVLLGANALLANGYVMSRAGTAQVALMAKFYNVPVLVCCETHKFSERVQTDAFVFNEIGDPQDLVLKTGKYTSNEMQNWKSIPQLTPLNLRYDITPPELVAAVVTELAILPCTSVPVILRIKPSESGY